MKIETAGSRVMIYRLILITNRQAVTLKMMKPLEKKMSFNAQKSK